ncbi:LMBR1 domain-containing protein [Spiroplasma endosymbiont of Lasioglossum malachurum]|uniref:LMBR1 domain-containing protein n=1 Tax=Spiroplasma endosymbiont of Lasioglossum malachurum TaxID=3066319 RepID=UPI0030CE3492
MGCIVISTTLGLIPTAIIMGITAIKPIAIAVSIGIGFIAIPWNNIRNKIVDWVFKRKENKFIKKNYLKVERKRYEKQKQERKFENLNNQIKELKQTLEFQNKLLEINNNELPKINK